MKRLLYIIGVVTIMVWATTFFGYGGNTHTFIVMGLIILAFIIMFIRIITEDDFL